MKKYVYTLLLCVSLAINAALLFHISSGDSVLGIRKESSQSYWVTDNYLHRDIIRLIDKDSDGRFDFIYLPIYDKNGTLIRDVVDYDYDGQADIHLEMDGSGGYVWFRDGWYKFHRDKAKDRRFIVVQNTEIELTPENSPYIKWHRKLFGEAKPLPVAAPGT